MPRLASQLSWGMLAVATWAVVVLSADAAEPKTQLVVVVSIDQFCYEYLDRFRDGYAEDGIFERIAQRGANFTNCHHRHAFTYTAPGHSVQLTGCYPNLNGIVENNWYDHDLGRERYCVDDSDHELVGLPPAVRAAFDKLPIVRRAVDDRGKSPRSLRVEAVGDSLRRKDSKAKVLGVALKDRASILMTGQRPNAAYWFHDSGHWVTSTYYLDKLPEYVTQLNESPFARQWLGQAWDLLLPLERYKLHRPDDNKFEGTASGLGNVFPHPFRKEISPLPKEIKAQTENYFAQVATSPFGNDLTLKMVREVVTHEQLGRDESPDLLCINLSSNDYVGHNFDPYSLEVADISYRTDRQLGQLATWLDEQVGADRWTLFITADHGVAPNPDFAPQLGLPGKRNPLGSSAQVRADLEELLVKEFGPSSNGRNYIAYFASCQIYFDRRQTNLAGGNLARAQRLVCDWLAKHPAIGGAITRDDLASGATVDVKFLEGLQRAFHPERSGDVLYFLLPYQFQGGTPATHGSPYDYDSHVPLLAVGAGIRGGKFDRPTSPAAVAPTVAQLLDVTPPATCVEKPLHEALQ